MADSVSVTNFPKEGSPERVAYDLYFHLRQALPKGANVAEVAQKHLALYAECFNATRGRAFDTSKLG